MATILCIDDEPSVLEIESVLLASKGYEVLTASDGPTGIALAREHAMAAVLLDFNMPGMDGSQVAEVLWKEQPTLPVLIWSGCPGQMPESLRWLADAVLHKGDGPDTLLSVLDRVVSGTITRKKTGARTHRRGAVSDVSPAA